MDIGSTFKEKRESLGLSVEDVSIRTLIKIDYLNAIEENKFAAIPAEIMVLGFLRNYSNFLGLDPEHIITEYRNANPVKLDIKIPNLKIDGMRFRKNVGPRIAPLLLLALAIAVLYGLVKISISVTKSVKEARTAAAQQEARTNHLELHTTDNVWIRIKAGDNSVFEGIIPPNSTKLFDSTEQFSLRIGNLSGLAVVLNGVPVNLPKGKLVGEIKVP